MATKPPKSVCKFGAVADLFAEHGTWFSNHETLRRTGVIDPGRLLNKYLIDV